MPTLTTGDITERQPHSSRTVFPAQGEWTSPRPRDSRHEFVRVQLGGGNITNPRQMPCSVTVTEQEAGERPRPTSRRCACANARWSPFAPRPRSTCFSSARRLEVEDGGIPLLWLSGW